MCLQKVSATDPSLEAVVPMVKVQLVQSAKILPQQSMHVTARADIGLEERGC